MHTDQYTRYTLPTVERKDYSVMIYGKTFLANKANKSDARAYKNFRKITTVQGDGNIPGCFLDYPYFNKHYKLIAGNSKKQQELDAEQYNKLSNTTK